MPRPPISRVDVRSPTIALAKPSQRLTRTTGVAVDDLLTGDARGLQSIEANRSPRLAEAARALRVEPPTLRLAPTLRAPGDTVSFDLADATSRVYGWRIRDVTRHHNGVSYMIPSPSGAVSTVVELDLTHARGIYVATFHVSTNQSEPTLTGYVRHGVDTLLETPVVLSHEICVFAFSIEEAVGSFECGLEFPNHDGTALFVFRRGEVTKLK